MKHEDFKLKLTGSYGYTFPSQAYNMDFQIISEGLKKNLWFKIGSGEGGDTEFAWCLERIMCLLPCFPPTTNTRFSNQQLEKQKLPVKVKHDMQKAFFFPFMQIQKRKASSFRPWD